jgi:UDP-N-acetylglucosamine 2-epimerase (hydrolysing)
MSEPGPVTDRREVLFVTGTRADFGKLRDVMRAVQDSTRLRLRILVTGMHLLHRYGYTVREIERAGLEGLHLIPNQVEGEPMPMVLANTVQAVTRLVHEEQPDAIVVHGDRIEALAGALAGSLSNVLVVHIEGGEVSGTIDDAIRHSISKHAHVHLVANETARDRLIQMGEQDERIFVVGSPEVDVIASPDLPTSGQVRRRYDIPFDDYGVLVWHPVTTEPEHHRAHARTVVDAVLEDGHHFVVIDPNNDSGCREVRAELDRLTGPRFVRLPSMRFEFFLSLMRDAELVVGNSSAGVREAPVLGTPSVTIGTRQRRRASTPSVLPAPPEKPAVLAAMARARALGRCVPVNGFGTPGAQRRIVELLHGERLWTLSRYKEFVDRP